MSNFNFLKTWLPLLVFVIVLAFLWRGLGLNPHRLPSAFINKPLPAFEAQRLAEPQLTISNHDLKGHVLLLNVFATWCLSCRAEHPVLMDIKNSKAVRIYGLDYKDSRKTALSWLKQYGNPYTKIIYDPDGRVGMNLGVYGTPETFIIDREGIVRYKYVGPMSPRAWRKQVLPRVKKLLGD